MFWVEEFTLKQDVINAFTDMLFHGKQAAVCVLDEWTPDKLMMDNTTENSFSETAFTVRREQYDN